MTKLHRRTLLAAGAALPLLGVGAAAATSTDPDQLFRAGRFAEADRGYQRLIQHDPANTHAVAQRGYIALLHNRFPDAEKHLSAAVRMGDAVSRQRLAECLVRQDKHASAVPVLRSTHHPRDEAYAKLYDQLGGPAWQIRGAASTRTPFLSVDPVPSVMASLNGGPPRGFLLDTYSTLDLSADVAEEIGLRSIATISGVASGGPVTIHLGVLESIRIGAIELRNIPMQWIDMMRPPLPDGSQPAGVIGTTTFYHLLTTMDYAGQALELRRKGARSVGGDRLPLWLAGDHYPCSVGSMGSLGPRIVTLDTGGLNHGLDTTVDYAERAGLAIDYDHPIDFGGRLAYPVTADRISLGRAVGRDIRGIAAADPVNGMPGPGQAAMFGFDPIANFTHEFFKPYAITFDYTAMTICIHRR